MNIHVGSSEKYCPYKGRIYTVSGSLIILILVLVSRIMIINRQDILVIILIQTKINLEFKSKQNEYN